MQQPLFPWARATAAGARPDLALDVSPGGCEHAFTGYGAGWGVRRGRHVGRIICPHDMLAMS